MTFPAGWLPTSTDHVGHLRLHLHHHHHHLIQSPSPLWVLEGDGFCLFCKLAVLFFVQIQPIFKERNKKNTFVFLGVDPPAPLPLAAPLHPGIPQCNAIPLVLGLMFNGRLIFWSTVSQSLGLIISWSLGLMVSWSHGLKVSWSTVSPSGLPERVHLVDGLGHCGEIRVRGPSKALVGP